MKKSIKFNSGNIISIRKKLDTEILTSWKLIRNENIMSKKAIKAGLGSGKDLKALYNRITQLQEKRIKIKGMLCYLNSGTTTFNFEDFKKTNNYHIFAAGEAKEAIAQLNMIKTINPSLKAEKGLKGLANKETFTAQKITSMIKELQLIANKHDAELEKFNNETSLDISDYADDFKEYITT